MFSNEHESSMIYFLIVAALLVAFANGGNDNAKGVATLIGSRQAATRIALLWANVTTFLGALSAIPVALFVNATLLKAFGGSGLLPTSFRIDAQYLMAVGCAAAMTVLLATKLGLPVSTTHSLLGGLIGAGLVAVGPANITWSALSAKLVLPLLLSPILSAVVTVLVFPLFHRLMIASKLEQGLCLCLGGMYEPVVDDGGILTLARSGRVLTMGEISQCQTRFSGSVLTVPGHAIVTVGQFITSGLVSFARGLNDTPKIAGIVVVAGALEASQRGIHSIFSVTPSMTLVAIAMLLGGIILAKAVARTMAYHITAMDAEQGLLGSLVSAILVLLASLNGLPVSTTHVTVGALFGIGASNGTAKLKTISTILAAWLLTLPLAAFLGVVMFLVVNLH